MPARVATWLDGQMTRYADPQRCPDCQSPIPAAPAACAACGLLLRGETALQLFQTLTRADDLLSALRSASAGHVPVGSGSGGSPGVPSPGVPSPGHPSRGAPHRRGLSAASVPKILLALGAACLLVAALVFLAVAWSALGVGGRTAVLTGLTAAAGSLAGWLARRGLRSAAEALALVGYGLLALDLTGAHHAGWVGALSGPGLLVLVGGTLTLAATAGAWAARRTPIGRLAVAEVVVALGTALAVTGLADPSRLSPASALVAGLLLAATVTAAVDRLRLRVATRAVAVVTAATWLALTVSALDRVAGLDRTWASLYAELAVWPLLVAAGAAGAAALLHRAPRPVRVGCAALGELLLAVALLAPVRHLDATVATLVGLALLGVLAALTWWLPRPWRLVSVVTQAATGAAALAVATDLGARATLRLAEAATPVWSGQAGDRLPGLAPRPSARWSDWWSDWSAPGGGSLTGASLGPPAPWLLPLVVLLLVATVVSLTGRGRRTAKPTGARPVGRTAFPADRSAGAVVATALLGASAVGALALFPVPVWTVPAALLAAAGAGVRRALHRDHAGASLAAGAAAVSAVLVSLHADLLTALTLLAVVGLAAVVHLRCASTEQATAAGGVQALAVGSAVWSWASVLDVPAGPAALAGLLALGGLVLATPYTPARWWADVDAVVGSEVGAATAAVPLATAGVLLAPPVELVGWTAVYLTVAGVVVTAMALLRADRREVGWAGALLLTAATWVRLADLGVHQPEAYTLPAAAALLIAGLVRLRRDPATSTVTALAPGLLLALVPSLLWALVEPVGLRSLVLGLGCLVLLLSGARRGWTCSGGRGRDGRRAAAAPAGGAVRRRGDAPLVADRGHRRTAGDRRGHLGAAAARGTTAGRLRASAALGRATAPASRQDTGAVQLLPVPLVGT